MPFLYTQIIYYIINVRPSFFGPSVEKTLESYCNKNKNILLENQRKPDESRSTNFASKNLGFILKKLKEANWK